MNDINYRQYIKALWEFGISEATIGRIAGWVSVYVVRQLLLTSAYKPTQTTHKRIIKGIEYFLSLSETLHKKQTIKDAE